MKSFYEVYENYKNFNFEEFFESVSETEILRILQKDRITKFEFLALLSPVAEKYIEEMARKSNQLTTQYFGKTIQFFTPIYLSNYCNNHCVYCGFNHKNKIERKQLTLDEVDSEARMISSTGLRHILALTGDAPKVATVDYLKDCIQILKKYFNSIGIEIYVLQDFEYEKLIKAGVDSLSIYQETYDEKLYSELHPKGPKRDYMFRLDAPERASLKGIRSVNIGALLGLDEWRKEVFYLGTHGEYLQNKFPDVDYGISLPRMRPHTGEFQPTTYVDDKSFVQIMTALRIYLPRVGITVSTRENQTFRDNILPLGVTKMSAGSTTAVGGHTQEDNTSQFDISDERSVEEMTAAINNLGYQPVFKDWQEF